MPTLEFQAIVNSLKSAIFTPGNLVTVSAVTTVANIPVLDLTVNQIDTDSFTLDETTDPPTLRITAHPEQSPWHSNIDAAGFQLFDIPVIRFADGTIQTTAYNAGTIGQTPWLQDIDAFNHNLTELNSLRFSDLSIQNTAFHGIAATQTPWLQNIDAGGHSLSNIIGITGSGTILSTKFQTSQGPIWIIPSPGAPAFVIYNNDATIQYWIVDGAGNLASDNGRNITGVGSIGLSGGLGQVNGITQLQFTDASTQTTAYTGIAANQTPWLQDINAANFALRYVSHLYLKPTAGGNPLIIANAAETAWDWVVDSAGNISTGSGRSIGSLGSIGFADGTNQTTAYQGIRATQTPWLQDIDASYHWLQNLNRLIFGVSGQTGGVAIANWGPDFLMFADSATMQIRKSIYVGSIDASENVVVAGGFFSNSGGVSQIGLSAISGGLLLGGTQELRWSSTAAYTGVIDLTLKRGGAGSLDIVNPLTGDFIFLHAAGGVRLPVGSSVRWSTDTNPGSAQTDCELRHASSGNGLQITSSVLGGYADLYCRNVSVNNIVAHAGITSLGVQFNTDAGYSVNGTPGLSGTFTTADGKTITVTVGIVTGIV